MVYFPQYFFVNQLGDFLLDMKQKILETVPSVGFAGMTGDRRWPEDFSLPSAMTSLVGYLKMSDAFPVLEHKGNGEDLEDSFERTGYSEFLAASGMAFALLWHGQFSGAVLDFALINPLDTSIARCFNRAGLAYNIYSTKEFTPIELKDKLKASIDQGMPVLAFGAMGFQECSILAGYDRDGDVAIGWCYQQYDADWAREENGMFRDGDWQKNILKLVVPGEVATPRFDFVSTLRMGVDHLLQRSSGPFAVGQSAYECWVAFLNSDLCDKCSDEILVNYYAICHALAGSLAESRWYAANFLRRHSKHDELRLAAENFVSIHERCRELWDIASGNGRNLHLSLRSRSKRMQMILQLERCAAADAESANRLLNALQMI